MTANTIRPLSIPSCILASVFISWRTSLALVFAVVFTTSAQAQLSGYGDISIQVEAPQVTGVGNGYGEYRARVANNSATQSHRVTVALQFAPYGSEHGIREIRREVELAPQAKATISMFVPMLENAYGAQVFIDGERQREEVEVINRAGVLDAGDREFGLFLSPKIFKSGLMSKSNFEEGFKDSESNKQVATQSPEIPVTEWSDNWLSYARFDGVVVSSEELNAASEAVRSALFRYVERGGSLVVAGNWQVPPQWRARQGFITNDNIKNAEDEEPSGPALSATPVPPAATGESQNPSAVVAKGNVLAPFAAQAKSPTDLRIFFIGFGTLTITGAVDPGQIAVNQWKWSSRNFQASRIANSDYFTLAEFNQAFKVVEKFGVPMRGLFLLMLVFVIIIGPINLIWLAKRKRKIWMLWTVPAISLLTCLAVASFALFGEGWNATARTEALTILDESDHRATTIGWTAFYSPITPSEGLHFGYDTELDPQLPGNLRYGRRGISERTIDWTNDQHLDSGWITARVPVFFRLRKSETRRERLSIRQETNGNASLVNGLGAEISQVWWADGNGKIHSATNIPAGAQAILQPTDLKAAGEPSTLREAFNQNWLEQFKLFSDQPQTVLMPNSYLAVLNASPFVEEGLKSVKLRIARNLVYGITPVSAGGGR